MASHNTVPKLYRSVVDDVINNVREAFLDEGVDEQVLQELKQLWESKLQQSKAVDPVNGEQDKLYTLYQQHQQQQAQQAQPHPQAPQTVITSQTPTINVTPVTQKQVLAQSVTLSQPTQLPQGIQFTAANLSAGAQQATLALPGGILPQQIAALGNGTITLQTAPGSAQIILQSQLQQSAAQGATTITMANPQQMTATQMAAVQQLARNQALAASGHLTPKTEQKGVIRQIDGANDSSSDDDYDKDDDDDDDDDDNENEENNDAEGEEEEPLNSGDDISDHEPSDLFDTDNVVVCQYDKINRNKNKWKFHLKDGIMNLKGKDYVFSKANGEAEW